MPDSTLVGLGAAAALDGTESVYVVQVGADKEATVAQIKTFATAELTNVDNTSDVDKPVSTAQAAADALKVAKTGDTMTGPLVMAAKLDIQQDVARTGIITPITLAATANDYAPIGHATASVWRISASVANTIITGIVGGYSGREITLVNVGAQQILLQYENVGSVAANRFVQGPAPTHVTLPSGSFLDLWYDTAVSRWRTRQLSAIDQANATSARLNLGFPVTTSDNTVPRFDGAAGAMQTSAVFISDQNIVALPEVGGGIGGMLYLNKNTGSALNGAAIQIYQQGTRLNINETGAPNRGVFLDLANCVANDLAPFGPQQIWIPAAAMKPRTTNGPASGSVETTTNKVMIDTLDFDTTTQEFAQFSIRMPVSWNEGTVTFSPIWSHAATTTNFGVTFSLAGVAFSNDDAMDAAFGTAVTSVDTGGTTNDEYEGPASSAVTIAGTPAANDLVVFQVARVPADAGDTMAIDARLHGVVLTITTDAGHD